MEASPRPEYERDVLSCSSLVVSRYWKGLANDTADANGCAIMLLGDGVMSSSVSPEAINANPDSVRSTAGS